MRVLFLIPSLGGGGAERQVTYLARGLSDRGIDVHAGFFRGGPNLQPIMEAGATVHWITSRGSYDPLMLPRIVRLIRRVQPDVVQTYLTQMDVLGGLAAQLTGTPWIVSERGAGDFYPRDLRHALRRFIGRHAHAVVANSSGGLSFWESSRAARFVVRNAIPMEQIAAARPEELPLGESRLILYAGRLVGDKNVPNLIEALGLVVQERNVVAFLCGAGPEESRARLQIEKLGLSDRIRLTGYTDQLWSLMKRADVFVSVSWHEGHPNVVIEAAACGCPLVLSDIRAHREFLDDRSAEFAEPADATSIAAAITRALDDPGAARARAARAGQIVGRFSIAAAAAGYLDVYESISTAAGGRSSSRDGAHT